MLDENRRRTSIPNAKVDFAKTGNVLCKQFVNHKKQHLSDHPTLKRQDIGFFFGKSIVQRIQFLKRMVLYCDLKIRLMY